MIKRIRNSFKAGQSRATIMGKLQSKGFKLEYADALIKKAKPHGTWFYISLITILVLVLLVSLATYILFFQTGEKQEIINPLAGLNVLFEKNINNLTNDSIQEVYIEDIEITPEFLSYLLNEIGAWQLNSNPLTFEKPIINFKIDEDYFNSIIDGGIETLTGSSEKADIQFNTNKEDLVRALLSDEPAELFKESLAEGKTEIQTIAGNTELFSKGYLKLYDELK